MSADAVHFSVTLRFCNPELTAGPRSNIVLIVVAVVLVSYFRR